MNLKSAVESTTSDYNQHMSYSRYDSVVLFRLKWLIQISVLSLSCFAGVAVSHVDPSHLIAESKTEDLTRFTQAEQRLQKAIKNPEYLLDHWIALPTSSMTPEKKNQFLTLREAILLALRYNPNIQNAELDRIIQRYQLRLAHNEFELQYALRGEAQWGKSHYEGIGSTQTNSYFLTPEVRLKNKFGGEVALDMQNNVGAIGRYHGLVGFSYTQPLLSGFGRAVNEAGLLNAEDYEWLNKLNLQQAIIEQITQVIGNYRALILSGNTLQNQRLQLVEAQKLFTMNEKKIKAGQVAPTENIHQSYQIESLKLMVEQAENDFKTTAQQLLQMIGLDPEIQLAVPSDINLKEIEVPNLKEAIAQALSHNTQYLALAVALRVDERAYAVAKNQQKWQLNLNANVQAGRVTDIEDNTNGLKSIYNGRNVNGTAGVTLKIPVHDLKLRNQLIAAKVRLEQDRLNLISAKRLLVTTIKNIIATIESQAKRYVLAERQVELAKQSYTLEKKKELAGISSALDVNTTQNQLLQAQTGLINAKINYLNQLSELHRVTGSTLSYWQIKLRYGA